MAAIASNPLQGPIFEIPDPPEEFGKDGGKFYRAYDSLAGEIDEDMTTSLKEQLDGILVFAGLFAGVNTAFLALTIPLLSPDSSEDTNSLLAQNNAILLQLAMGRNDSLPTPSALPSHGFAPSGNVFAMNALFALSLAFAIISSFLAVLGRQWLVYYRKRSGGGPDHQRWEQLRRFLGAQRWRMELILDDVLPSLLQAGLIIFCVSLIMYLHYLSPALSVIVGVPLYVGLAVFIGSALCTLWDRFCPFHSPLSHLLTWGIGSLRLILIVAKQVFKTAFPSLREQHTSDTPGDRSPTDRTTKWTQWEYLRSTISQASITTLLGILGTSRKEESAEALQVIAIQRAICTSDDPDTLLFATANIVGITDVKQMEQLWSDEFFRDRFIHQFRSAWDWMLQLQGLDQVNLAVSARRLYCSAAAHIMLWLDVDRTAYPKFFEALGNYRGTMVLVPDQDLPHSPTCVVRATIGFTMLQLGTSFPLDGTIPRIRNYLATCSDQHGSQDWRLLCLFAWVISNYPELHNIWMDSDTMNSLRRAYRGDREQTFAIIRKALEVLTDPQFRTLLDSNRILISVLSYASRIISIVQSQSEVALETKFALLDCCESILQTDETPEEASQIVQKMRIDIAQVWLEEYMVWVNRYWNTAALLDPIEQHMTRNIANCQADPLRFARVAILEAFGPAVRQLFVEDGRFDRWPGVNERREPFRETYNRLVSIIDRNVRYLWKRSRRVRNPDEQWCHWEDELVSVEERYYIPSEISYESECGESQQD